MKISYNPHARDDMVERGISNEEVEATLENPDAEYPGYGGRIVAERTSEGRRLALKVVYNLGSEGERVVVAVMPADLESLAQKEATNDLRISI